MSFIIDLIQTGVYMFMFCLMFLLAYYVVFYVVFGKHKELFYEDVEDDEEEKGVHHAQH